MSDERRRHENQSCEPAAGFSDQCTDGHTEQSLRKSSCSRAIHSLLWPPRSRRSRTLVSPLPKPPPGGRRRSRRRPSDTTAVIMDASSPRPSSAHGHHQHRHHGHHHHGTSPSPSPRSSPSPPPALHAPARRHYHHAGHRPHWHPRRLQLPGAGVLGCARPVASTCTCLVKEYLPNGAVLFRDVCTNEVGSEPAGPGRRGSSARTVTRNNNNKSRN